MPFPLSGLFQNCRKVPYKNNGSAPIIGGAYGMFRGYGGGVGWLNGRPSITLACSSTSELVAKTAFAEATYQGSTISCWDSDTVTSNSGGVGTETDAIQRNGGSGVFLIASIVAPVSYYYNGFLGPSPSTFLGIGASRTYVFVGWRDAQSGHDYLRLLGITVVSSTFGLSFSYSLIVDGVTERSGTGSTRTINDGSAKSAFSPTYTKTLSHPTFCRIEVTITNTSGVSIPAASLYLFGSSIGLELSASNPALLTAGIWTAVVDAPGITSGDLYRTLTAETGGTGQTYLHWGYADALANLTSGGTATSTGTHTCELDELANRWVT